MKCDVCHQEIAKHQPRVYYYKENKDGTRSKRKTYEHIECANLIPLDQPIGEPTP